MNQSTVANLITLTYSTNLWWRGVDTIPEGKKEFFAPATLSKKISGVKTEYQGFKRKDVPVSIQYNVAADTPAYAIKAIEAQIHLYVKDLADSYQEVPAVLDEAAFIDWITPATGGNDGIDENALKAALAALGQYVTALTGNEARAAGTVFAVKGKFKTAAICSPKGFNVVSTQVPKVLEQLGTLLARFADAEISTGQEECIELWASQLASELALLQQAQENENLFAL